MREERKMIKVGECTVGPVNDCKETQNYDFITNVTPHQALVETPPGVSSASFMSMTTRNIFKANGISLDVYAVSAN